MRLYTNQADIPLSLAVYLATDKYDHNQDPKTISVTGLIKPLKQIIMSGRVSQEEGLIDLEGLLPSRMGTSIHDGIEHAWINNKDAAMRAMGYPQRVIDRVLVNPTADQLTEDCIPVYLERRSERAIAGYTISGKFDFIGEGRLEDFKTTSTFTWVNSTKDDDYILQGSIYRWLNQDIVTKDHMAIQFMFTDWSAAQARANPKYPSSRTKQRLFPLMSLAETENFISQKIRLIETYSQSDEADLPLCTDTELWRREPVWKYYKNSDSTKRSTKNFDSKQEAYLFMAQNKNVGKIVEVPGKAVACKYCRALPICNQAKNLIAAGDLDI